MQTETTVLHVDDDAQFLDLAALRLERVDAELTTVTRTSAEAGLERLDAGGIGCIVSDYDMPGTDGLEFLTTVRERGWNIPFILFTGKGSEEVASRAISAGVSDYIQKTGTSEQYELLANRVRNLVEKRHSERYIEEVYEAINHVEEGVSLVDEDGRFKYVNRAYAEMFGYERAELLGEHWRVLYRDEEDVRYIREELLPTLAAEETWAGTTRQARKDGTQIRTDHRLAYTSNEMLVCLVADTTPDDSLDSPIPVLETTESGERSTRGSQ